MEEEGFSLPVIEAHCGYRESARYDDDIEIQTRGTLLTPVRVRFEYDVVRSSDSAVLASGHTVHAVLDRAGHVVGMITRVDLISGLYRQTATQARKAA